MPALGQRLVFDQTIDAAHDSTMASTATAPMLCDSMFKGYGRSFTEQRSGGGGGGPLGNCQLSSAMSLVTLNGKEELGPLLPSAGSITQPLMSQDLSQRSGRYGMRALRMEVSSQPSQDMLCTPDFASQLQQQAFLSEFEGGGAMQDENSRSPAPSPVRHQKRPRPLIGDDTSDTASQQSQQSQGVSQGDPSTCSKPSASSGALGSKPPKPAAKPVKVAMPPSIRNPYLTPGTDNKTEYHTNIVHPSAKQRVSRLRWAFDAASLKVVGTGSFSEVFRATHRMSGKTYAIKRSKKPATLLADRNLWLSEIQVLAAVEGHPNVVTYYDAWAEEDPNTNGEFLHIQLELCSGGLKELAGKREPVVEAELLPILQQVSAGLKHVHSLGIAHLDIKPDNIYRSASGTYKLGDFGLATPKDGSGKWQEGDSRYMAPELMKAQTNTCLDKSDMFALGITLYELASGKALPAHGEGYTDLRKGHLSPLPHLSTKLTNLIKKLMSVEPEQRPSADAVLSMPLLHKLDSHSGRSSQKSEFLMNTR